MKKLPITPGLFITYSDVFSEPPPENRLSLLDNYSKREVLALLSLINLNPRRDPITHVISWDDQMTILGNIFQPNFELLKPHFTRIMIRQRKISRQGGTPYIFNRIANVVALEEVLSCVDLTHEGHERINPLNFFKYYLLVNSFISETQNEHSAKHSGFIDLFQLIAPMNEHQIPTNPYLDLFRAVKLVKFLEADKDLSKHYKRYFESVGIHPQIYIPMIWIYIVPMAKRKENDLPRIKPQSAVERRILEFLCSSEIISGKSLFEAINLRKSNVYPFDKSRDLYLLMDLPFLIDRIFYLQINSFWFDHFKKTGHKPSFYYGKIGRFYEQYICDRLKNAFQYLKHPSPKFLDDLKTLHPESKQPDEIADFYIQHNKRVIIGEIKFTQQHSEKKYTQTPIEIFRTNKEKFKKDFGVLQIVKGIKYFLKHPELISNKIEHKKQYKIYPVLVLNERLFQVPLANLMFQILLEEEFTKEFCQEPRTGSWHLPRSIEHLVIHPATVWHSTDVEILEPLLANRTIDIWKLFNAHHKNGLLHRPFYFTLYKHVSKDVTAHLFDNIIDILTPILKK